MACRRSSQLHQTASGPSVGSLLPSSAQMESADDGHLWRPGEHDAWVEASSSSSESSTLTDLLRRTRLPNDDAECLTKLNRVGEGGAECLRVCDPSDGWHGDSSMKQFFTT
mmetsp:Transcript_55908/g.127746  ORF Transcript_55908/g.127746 Transcript_55908/m.127746 type:complete len:111 (+) Transcript_55908:557-889(+)